MPLAAQAEGGITTTIRDDARWFAAGALVGDDFLGIRGEVDLWRKRGWALGGALELATQSMAQMTADNPYALEFQDIRAVAIASHTWGTGRVQLRTAAAAGLARTRVSGTTVAFPGFESADWFATADGSAQLIVHASPQWALALGPQLSIFGQEFRRESTNMTVVRRDFALSALASLRRRM